MLGFVHVRKAKKLQWAAQQIAKVDCALIVGISYT